MKRIAITFTFQTDIIIVPEDIAKNVKKIQRSFDRWLYDKDNDHGCWEIIDGKKMAVSFDTDVFVDYINNHCLAERCDKVLVKERNVNIALDVFSTLYF